MGVWSQEGGNVCIVMSIRGIPVCGDVGSGRGGGGQYDCLRAVPVCGDVESGWERKVSMTV